MPGTTFHRKIAKTFYLLTKPVNFVTFSGNIVIFPAGSIAIFK